MRAELMSKLPMGILLFLATLTFMGCSTVHPLKFDYYSRNLVLGKDNVLKIDDQRVDQANLRQELVSRTINETTPIVLHIHRDVTAETFDEVVNHLKAEGFRNLSFKIFTD